MPDGVADPNRQIRIGDSIEFPLHHMVVTAVGKQPHSKGYGDVDLLAYSLIGSVAPGDIVNTPWGQAEIVPAPESLTNVARIT